MGTPGDTSRIKKLGEPKAIQLEDENRNEQTAEPINQPQSLQIEPSTSDMTVLSRLHPPLIEYYINPPGIKLETGKLSQTYIDEFYTENKPTTVSDSSTFVEFRQEETFPSLEEPGPSGLQTPKKANPKIEIKRLKKTPQSPKKAHTCQICQKTFQNSSKLSKHQQSHGNGSPFKCEHCKKAFSSKFKLVRHVLIHSDRKPFSCSVCERTFHRKDHLKNHIKVHSPCKKLYVCEKPSCKKEYTSLLSYKKHLALHAAEEGILECQICSKSFKTKDEILYHLKIHAGSRTVKNPDEKKYSCDHCERKFFTRKDVRRHLVVHTGKRDFLCQFCPQRFGRKDHLVRHIKKSHIKNIKEEKTDVSIKSETEESNLSNPETFTADLDLESLFPGSFLETPPTSFLPHTSTQGELTDLGSEVLNEIGDTGSRTELFQEDSTLMADTTLIDLLREETRDENLPLPAFNQIFQTPPQQTPPKN